MKTEFDLTSPNLAQIRMVAKLNAIQAQLYAMHDYVGAEKVGHAVDHIQSEIDFYKDSFTTNFSGFTEVV